METRDITKLTLEQKKALAYDLIGQMEINQRNLQVLNEAIAKSTKEAQNGQEKKQEEVLNQPVTETSQEA